MGYFGDFRKHVYEARCRVTGLSYVGMAAYSVDVSWKNILAAARWGRRPVHDAINEHGADSFDVVSLANSLDALDIKRRRIAVLGFWPDSYNLPNPRQGGRRRGDHNLAAAEQGNHDGAQSRPEEEGHNSLPFAPDGPAAVF